METYAGDEVMREIKAANYGGGIFHGLVSDEAQKEAIFFSLKIMRLSIVTRQ